ncbi:MAG: hypothetical protein KDA80_16580 [Planctomycetaceae bacterium]|nr:hypothetical protein [Planctomycetaceae bacterium]
MSRLSLNMWRCLAVGGLITVIAGPVSAQSPESAGVVRITDVSHEEATPIPEGQPVPYGRPGCPTCPGGQGGNYGFAYQPGYGHGGYGHCPGGCQYPPYSAKMTYTARAILEWIHPCGSCTVSPGTGWAPPVKRPIYRTPVVYQQAFPNSWTGAPTGPQVRVPHVYMPTDTTQLGFYYQHVPYWQPRGAAIPPAPIPEQYHVSLCEADLHGKHPAGLILGTAPAVIDAPLYDADGIPYTPDAVSGTEAEATPTKVAEEPKLLPIQ